jgi:hypothetical protein
MRLLFCREYLSAEGRFLKVGLGFKVRINLARNPPNNPLADAGLPGAWYTAGKYE